MAKKTNFLEGLGSTLAGGIFGALAGLMPEPEIPEYNTYVSPYMRQSDVMLYNTIGRLLGAYLSSGWGLTPEMQRWFSGLANWFPIAPPGGGRGTGIAAGAALGALLGAIGRNKGSTRRMF